MLHALFGFFAGIISGMGIGGGVILIPLLVLFGHLEQQAAQGVNLFFFLPTGAIALWIHTKNKQVDYRAAWPLICFSLLGAIGGSWIAVSTVPTLLRKAFSVFLAVMSILTFLKKNEVNT